MKILLVEDDKMMGDITVLCLAKKGGHEVIRALSGPEALTLAAQEGPGLILMDVQMPWMDGLETCRRLKADEKTKDIPVILLSADTQARGEENAREVGAIGFISKPFEPIKLPGMLDEILIDRRSQ